MIAESVDSLAYRLDNLALTATQTAIYSCIPRVMHAQLQAHDKTILIILIDGGDNLQTRTTDPHNGVVVASGKSQLSAGAFAVAELHRV